MESAEEHSIKTITDHLESVGRFVRDALWRLEDPRGGIRDDPDVQEELEHYLRKLYIQLGLALEHLGLHASRMDLVRAWEYFEEQGIDKTVFYPEPGSVGNLTYDYLSAVIDGIRALSPCSIPTQDEQSEILRLEKLLERTAYLLHCRNVVPTKESDVQKVMDDYLRALYGADYHRQFSIPGVVKNFRPDSGIRSLGVAIEFKFVGNVQEMKTAVSGLFEDASGYKGSTDWKKFYSVIYMTGAYGTKEQLLAAFEHAGLVDWRPVLVTGEGARTRQNRQKQ